MILAGAGTKKVARCETLAGTVVIKEWSCSEGEGGDDPCRDKVAYCFTSVQSLSADSNKIYCYITSVKPGKYLLVSRSSAGQSVSWPGISSGTTENILIIETFTYGCRRSILKTRQSYLAYDSWNSLIRCQRLQPERRQRYPKRLSLKQKCPSRIPSALKSA